MAQDKDKSATEAGSDAEEMSIDRPSLTPQGDASGKASGGDATDPSGEGAKQGQGDKAEG